MIQSSVAMAYKEFDEHDRMRPSAYYDRVVDVMEALVKFTLLIRDRADYLVDRYSERKVGGGIPEHVVLGAEAMPPADYACPAKVSAVALANCLGE